MRQHGLQEIPVDADTAMRAVSLPDLHGDPFDRILLATATIRDLTILTRDRKIAQYPGVSVAW